MDMYISSLPGLDSSFAIPTVATAILFSNPVNALDVNDDKVISPIDVLIIINNCVKLQTISDDGSA